MKKVDLKINYLYNSGFIIETPNYLLVFDYYRNTPEKGRTGIEGGIISEHELTKNKKILVFVSHSHGDHYNPVILKWKEIREDINYIFSNDISIEGNSQSIHVIAPYEELDIDGVDVKAFGSTDIGASFLVETDGFNIFHAGDLNWWYWWDDTEEEIKNAEAMFKSEIDKIRGNKIDIAFFPVDPRLEHNFHMGGEYFIKEIHPGVLIPMHFGENYGITEKFSLMMKEYPTIVPAINYRGQRIEL